MTAIRRPAPLALRLLCVLALVMAAFAHRPAAASADAPAPAAVQMLPGGAVAVICFGADGNGGGHRFVKACDFCLIAGAAGLPDAPCGIPAAPGAAADLPTPPASGVRLSAFPPAAPPRGPPLASI